MREYRSERDRGSDGSSYESGQRVIDRHPTERPSEQVATDRLYQLRRETEAAVTRARKLAAIVPPDEWRAERASLTETHAALTGTSAAGEIA